jgi:hypothetical protein
MRPEVTKHTIVTHELPALRLEGYLISAFPNTAFSQRYYVALSISKNEFTIEGIANARQHFHAHKTRRSGPQGLVTRQSPVDLNIP